MKAKFLICLTYLLRRTLADHSEPDDHGEELPPHVVDPHRQKIEFLDNTSDETYLGALSFKDRYYLDLFMLHKTLRSLNFKLEKEANLYCPVDIYFNFGMKGFTNPMTRSADIQECANMRNNCCTANDYTMIDVFNKRYHQYLSINHDYHSFYIKEIIKYHGDYLDTAKLILEKKGTSKVCTMVAQTILKANVTTDTLEKVETLLKKARTSDEGLKKGIKCMLCDFDNTKFIDIEAKAIFMDKNVCAKILEGTFEYYMYARQFIWKYLNTANFLAHCAGKNPKTKEKYSGKFAMGEGVTFLPIDHPLYDEMCEHSLKTGNVDAIFQDCMNYCHKYSMWKYGGIFKDPQILAKMYKNIKNFLMRGELREVADLPEPLRDFKFPFTKAKFDFFTQYDVIYSVDGVQQNHLFQFATS